jgi:cytochrome c-type biogenesis protein CcmF
MSVLTARPLGYYGMHLAHLGVAVSIVGITIVTGYQVERDVRMNIGDVVNVAGYDFMLRRTSEVTGPNYFGVRADVEISTGGRTFRTLQPEKRVYSASMNAMSETAIDAGPFRDLYLSLGEPLGGGAWSVRVHYKPFVGWIWAGALLMAAGGALSAGDRRYRR